MQEHDRGNYRDQRRRAAKQAAEAYKDGKAEEMFFGASPSERKGLRKTKDKRTVDVDKLNLDGLDREKFKAPEKVGENLRLIDMAMGNEPDAPASPAVHPASPKKEAQPRPKKKAKRRPKSRMPSWFRKKKPAAPERDDFKPAPTTGDEGVVVAAPKGRKLEAFLWFVGLTALVAGVAGALPDYVLPAAAVTFPDGLQALLNSRHGLLGLGAVVLWLAIGVRIVRRPRSGFGGELARAAVLAAPVGLLVGGLIQAAGRTPSLGLAPDGLLPALAPLEPHVTALGIPLGAAVGAAVFLAALVPALVLRLRAPTL